jgi:xylose isomerase
VQLHCAAPDAEGLLLPVVAVDRRVPVLGATLVGEQDELLRAHAIGVDVDDDLQSDFVEPTQAEVRDLDALALSGRQHDAGLVEHGHRALARLGIGQHAGDTRLREVKTSLGIWALGPMVTRFVPGGYQPQRVGETTAERVRRAVEGLGDLMDGYEFHYPQELSAENLDEVRGALDGHDIYCIATGLHLDPRFGKGGLVSPDPATRDEAVKRTLEAVDFSGELGAHFIIWPGVEGYNYPFQTPYAESWAWLVDGIGQAAQRCRDHGILLFLEHKNSEPAMKILMRNIGMTLHVIHKLRGQGLDNVKVNMDWQHLLMNGENLGEYAAMLAAEGLLGHQHANSGWGTFDDDNMVGATAFMETLELAVELRRAAYGANGERLGFDLYPYTEDAVAAVKRSVLQWRFIDSVAARIDDAALREAQLRKDAVRAYELVYAALGE